MPLRPLLLTLLLAAPAHADDWHGKKYIIQLSSSQYASGYGKYLLPPLLGALKTSGMRDAKGPGADVAVSVATAAPAARADPSAKTFPVG